MTHRRRAVAGAGAAVVAAALGAAPAASAHGLVGRKDLPIPQWLFGWAAAVVLVISFVALATLWPSPRLESLRERRLFRVPPSVEPVCGLIGVAAFAFVVYAGFAGTDVPTANILPTVVYVLFWVGLVPVSLVLGDVFALFNPWRAAGRAIGWTVRRARGGRGPALAPYPERLGRWPAVAGIFAFAVLELAVVPITREDPATLASLALVYAGVQLVGMGLYGVEAWSVRGDAFGVYFGLFARLSPLCRRDGALWLRVPLSGAPGLTVVPGTVALLCVMIGSTAFDGGAEGPVWTSIAPGLQGRLTDLGLSADLATEVAFTIGLLAFVAFVAAIYWIGVAGMRTIRSAPGRGELAARYVHTLVPIAAAYVIAHYFSLLAYQGQAVSFLFPDPLGHGDGMTGGIDYTFIAATTIWYVQVGVLVAGHVCGLMLAHDRALGLFRTARQGTRSQYWMLVVMVGFTSLGLWLLSSSNG